MDKRLSRAIGFLRFPLTVLVVFIHVVRPEDGLFEKWWLDTICSAAVPAFFFISGILYFQGECGWHSFKGKNKRRIRTLLVPYLIWNSILILWIWFLTPDPQLTAGNLLAGLWDAHYSFIHAASHSPMDFPLWYVRDLMVCCLLSPVYFLIIKKTRWLLPAVCIVLLVCGINIPAPGLSVISIAFFSAGAYMSIHKVNLLNLVPPLLSASCIVVFLAYFPFGEYVWFRYVLWPAILLFILLLFRIGDSLSGKVRSITALGSSSFFVYASHAIIIRHVSQVVYSFPSVPSWVCYILACTIVVCICICMEKVIQRISPSLHNLLCGKRMRIAGKASQNQ